MIPNLPIFNIILNSNLPRLFDANLLQYSLSRFLQNRTRLPPPPSVRTPLPSHRSTRREDLHRHNSRTLLPLGNQILIAAPATRSSSTARGRRFGQCVPVLVCRGLDFVFGFLVAAVLEQGDEDECVRCEGREEDVERGDERAEGLLASVLDYAGKLVER